MRNIDSAMLLSCNAPAEKAVEVREEMGCESMPCRFCAGKGWDGALEWHADECVQGGGNKSRKDACNDLDAIKRIVGGGSQASMC